MRKKNPPPLTPKKWPCLRKNHKNYVFSNLRGKKTQLGGNQYSKVNFMWFLANKMRITKLFSKLRLVKNWQSGREKREALSTENRDHFSLFPYNLHFLVKLGCMSYVTIICSPKFPIQWRFQILCTLKIDLSASLYVRPTFQGVAINLDIHSYICQVGNLKTKFQWPEYSDQYLE